MCKLLGPGYGKGKFSAWIVVSLEHQAGLSRDCCYNVTTY